MYEDMIQILTSYPKHLDGKVCIQELKDNDYNWRQMEWAVVKFNQFVSIR